MIVLYSDCVNLLLGSACQNCTEGQKWLSRAPAHAEILSVLAAYLRKK